MHRLVGRASASAAAAVIGAAASRSTSYSYGDGGCAITITRAGSGGGVRGCYLRSRRGDNRLVNHSAPIVAKLLFGIPQFDFKQGYPFGTAAKQFFVMSYLRGKLIFFVLVSTSVGPGDLRQAHLGYHLGLFVRQLVLEPDSFFGGSLPVRFLKYTNNGLGVSCANNESFHDGQPRPVLGQLKSQAAF